MTFNGILDGDDVLAPELMENFRHRRMGDNIVPMDEDGNDADGLYSFGEEGCEALGVYTKKIDVSDQTHLVAYGSGDLAINESAGTPYYMNGNYVFFDTALIKRGGFSTWVGGDPFEIPESGLYRIEFKASVHHTRNPDSVYKWIMAIDKPQGTAISYSDNLEVNSQTITNGVFELPTIWAEEVFTAGDVLQFFIQLSKISGTNRDGNLISGKTRTRISIRKIGAA